MEEMIDRVARAIGTEDGHSLTEADYLNMARAAIEAMQEPTNEMLAAGSTAIFHSERDWQANAAYRAMVSSALSPSTRGE